MKSPPIFRNVKVSRWRLLRLAVTLLLALTALPVQAADYIFSATSTTFPNSCSYVIVGSYTCASLNLESGDTITMAPMTPSSPATINVGGVLSMEDATVNISGLAADLNIVVVGTVALINTQVNANVSSLAAVNIHPGSVINGNLSATTTTGVIVLFTNTIVEGSVNTSDGAISVGVGTQVLGSIASVSGVVTLFTTSSVGGDIVTSAGAITIGDQGTVGGDIVTDAGAITIGNEATVGGNVSSTGAGVVSIGFNVVVAGNVVTQDGGITVGGGSTVLGSVTTPIGIVTLGASSNVGGDVITNTGAITIIDGSEVGGSVRSTGAGVITLGVNVVVGVDVNSDVGAISIASGSSVCGDVGSAGAGILTLTTNVSVGGGVFSVVGAITIGSGSTVQESIRITGAGVMTLTGVQAGGDIYTLVGAATATNVLIRGTVTVANILLTPQPAWANQTALDVPSSAACDALLTPTPPDILILKSVQAYSDPVNLQNNPKAIPGAVMIFTIHITNRGGSVDSDTVVITDPMPANTMIFANDINGAGSGPLVITEGTSVSGLSYAFDSLGSTTDNISFSNDNGVSYAYTPIPNVDGYDSAVTDIKVSLGGTFNASSGAPHPSTSISFRVIVQ
jgi:hypothetical protein